MLSVLPVLLISVCGAMLFILGNGIALQRRNPCLPPWIKRFCKGEQLTVGGLTELALWLMAALMLLLLSAHFTVYYLMQHDTVILPTALTVLMNLLVYGGITLTLWVDDGRFARCMISVLAAAAILLAAEVIVCNGKSFSREMTDETLGTEALTYTESSAIQDHGDTLVLHGNAQLTLEHLPEHTRAIIPLFSRTDTASHKPFLMQVMMTDDSSATEYQRAAVKYLMATGRECSVTLYPYGSLHSIQLDLTQISSPVTLSGVRVLSVVPFHFSLLRWLLLLGICTTVIFIRRYRLYTVIYDPNHMGHSLAVTGMTVLCCLSCLCFIRPDQKAIDYTVGKDYSGHNLYIQQFDAFQKGQLALDIEAAPELEDLENVYDRKARDASGIYYKWDFAYYEGKYYSYFGLTPLFTFYYPYYLLTGKLPTIPMAMVAFSVCAICFFCLTLLSLLHLLRCKVNLLLLLLSLPAGVAALGIHQALQWSESIYYLPVAAGMCFLFLSLLLGFRGCCATGKKARLLWLAGSGVSLALCAGARPTLAIHAAVLLPFFFGILCRSREKRSFRAAQAVSFLLPVCVGVGGLLIYNQLRFGSLMEFGASYQLTVSDVRANELRLANLPAALWHYFCQLPRPRNTFPYFEPQYFGLDNYGRYVFNSHQIGALTYPMIGLGLLMLPQGAFTKADGTDRNITLLQKKAFLAIAAIVPLFIAWFDFCVGGADTRYTMDILPTLALLAPLVLLRANWQPKKHTYLLCAAAMLLTIGIQFLLMIQIPEGSLFLRCPNLYETAEDLLIFWR